MMADSASFVGGMPLALISASCAERQLSLKRTRTPDALHQLQCRIGQRTGHAAFRECWPDGAQNNTLRARCRR